MLRFLFILLVSLVTSAQATTVRVGFQTGDINTLLMYAAQTGQFARNGVEVKLTPFPAGPAMLPALAAGEIDLAWMGEFPAVTGFSNGMPIEILMMERLDFTNVRLVVNPAAGIQTVADLKGKKVAVSVGSTSHNHLLRALSQAGLRQDEVTIVNLSPANMPPAYVAGQVDAALTWEPNVGLMEKAGARPIATTRSLGMITGGIWVARQAFTKDSPAAVQGFLKTWREAQKTYVANPSEVRQYEAKRVGQSAQEFDALIARQTASHPSFEQLLTADFMGPPGKELDSRLMKHLQAIGAFLVAEKRISATPANWAPIFNTRPIQDFLRAEKP
ncbi:NrtA/SsuA/CpmA family ABC transporter substrate-binding protein [Piscinibacter gummiphilus]|uniref:NrtA/SsuA/CpmA family ABC transporter substrate-binding protein n=1 Tax=Piscinibacter gummiphilus TaxID=946333 RepID=A0ABZ0CW69_9BURK|nr:NrtA/SsuA/CpmA family ABC transporter substrate-binding protein [Piscinibacter gummiphilus]WOB07108.1 NrtA/SsuA/CpmA family ABC transporter substrate-binding protein [Piscinibacter gummiphilus]